jgi:hypothetical protein
MSKNSDEPKDKINELDLVTDDLWDSIIEHSKKIDDLEKEMSGNYDDLWDEIKSYNDDHQKISFHEQKIEALLRRVKNLENRTNSEDDIVYKLERLSVLKEKGVLSNEEFLEQKTKILNS